MVVIDKLFLSALPRLFHPGRSWLAMLLLTSLMLLTAADVFADVSPTASAGATMAREPVSGSRVYISQAGKEHPESVVLIHGLGDLASDTWQELIPRLARNYHVIAFDLPGFGRSEKANLLYSPGYYAEVTKWIVATYVPGPYHLIGHSLGAAVALRFAASGPDRLQTLTLANAAGILHRTTFARNLLQPDFKERLPGRPEQPEQTFDSLLSRLIEELDRLPFEGEMLLQNEFLRGTILGGDPARIAALALVSENFSAVLFKIMTPTLIIWGDQDRVTPLRTGRVLQSILTNSHLQIIPAAGHLPMLEQPKLFNETILAYLERKPGPSMPAEVPGGAIGRCKGQSGQFFQGIYREIEIENCTDVIIRNVVSGRITLSNATATIENSRIISADTGLLVRDSVISASGLKIEADLALAVERSRCDLAGTHLNASRLPIQADAASIILFSVSRIQTPDSARYWHGLWP